MPVSVFLVKDCIHLHIFLSENKKDYITHTRDE